MFENLSSRLTGTIDRLRGRGRLTEENISEALREVRTALLEADVALPVVHDFLDAVKTRAVGQEVLKSLSPGQELVRVVRGELARLMGEAGEGLALNAAPPVVILLAGLQGSGKTTTAAKLARHLSQREKKKVMLVSVDVYRPAAIEQLRTLAGEIDVEFCPSEVGEKPVAIVERALTAARRHGCDVLIVDTAGRLHVDEQMMQEVRELHAAARPVETLFVVDSMTGQDAANTARAFGDALPLTGVVLTKTDGDARGGAALSIRAITGKPIKFIGAGEKVDALEPFHPDRMASRILGMGDVLSLIEEAEHKVDRDQAEKLAEKLRKGRDFGLEDFQGQIREMRKMGGMAGLLDKLPGVPAGAAGGQLAGFGDKEMVRFDAIINSMTPHERRFPAVIKGSRRRRIAAGSGTEVQHVNRLLKQFAQMQKMMKRMRKKGGMANILRGMGGQAPGGMPPMPGRR